MCHKNEFSPLAISDSSPSPLGFTSSLKVPGRVKRHTKLNARTDPLPANSKSASPNVRIVSVQKITTAKHLPEQRSGEYT